MITFDEAITILAAHCPSLNAESVPLAAAATRVLAEPCIARIDSPRADLSTMDGYAVRSRDVAPDTPWEVIGTAFAGAPFGGAIDAGQCVRIFTGAPLPAGADRVLIQEVVFRDGDRATLRGDPGEECYVRSAGADFRSGAVLLPKGRLLDARALVAAAAADVSALAVVRRPRLTVLATGDELAEPGEARAAAWSIPESASFGVAALAESWGGAVADRRRIADDLAELGAAVAAAIERSDVTVVIGGASVGDRDYARRAAADLGAELLFAGVAIRPGKPVWLARANDRLVLGLPGNPTSAMVTARLFLVPMLALLGGRDVGTALRWRRARLGGALPATGSRETFVRAALHDEGLALPLDNQDSGAQRALADADLLIRCAPGSPAAPAGADVQGLEL